MWCRLMVIFLVGYVNRMQSRSDHGPVSVASIAKFKLVHLHAGISLL
jgi:hypothetical protein